jgi:hypothetical protein
MLYRAVGSCITSNNDLTNPTWRTAEMNTEVLEGSQQILCNIVKEYDPKDIYNMDEMHCFTECSLTGPSQMDQ